MAEEKKEVVEIKEEQPAQQEEGMGENNKFSLTTFILSVVGFIVCGGWIVGGIAAIVLGGISLKRLQSSNPSKQPFQTFDKVSKPVAIVDIVLGILSVIGWTVYLIVVIVGAIIAAVNGASA